MDIHHIFNTKEEREQRVRELLDIVGLKPDHIRRYPHEFSGGQRQRIGRCQNTCLNPQFIVCDEPISALDVSIQAQVINLLEHIQKEMGISYLFIAHDLSMVKHISDRIGVMYLGNLVNRNSDDVSPPASPVYTGFIISSTDSRSPCCQKKKRIVLEGELPSPLDTEWLHRIPYPLSQCHRALCQEKAGNGKRRKRTVACFLYEK